jgi:phosphoesterase RecJ-like protein
VLREDIYMNAYKNLYANNGAATKGIDNDTADGFSLEYIREIKEVEVSCVLKENEEGTKVSLRSKNNIDVSNISVKFGGGGHSKAAGFEVNDNIENTKKIILEECKEYFG